MTRSLGRLQRCGVNSSKLGSAVRQLNQSGLDSAAAQLLLVRKRAELEDLMKLAKRSSLS